jgi:hypothetical protein
MFTLIKKIFKKYKDSVLTPLDPEEYTDLITW